MYRSHVFRFVAPDSGKSAGLLLQGKMEPIGLLIKKELERQERSISWFARKIGCDRSNVYRLFQKNSIDTQLLARISVVLSHDFFSDLSASISPDQQVQNPQ